MPDPILVVGSSGHAGRMHSAIYENQAWAWKAVDPRRGEDGRPPEGNLEGFIVDVCTPTAAHSETLLEFYARGARRFIMEKPQAADADEWTRCRTLSTDATIFSVHNYMWSNAFGSALDALGPIRLMTTDFDKDRRADDWNGRGGLSGGLAHVLQVEAPHQFAMASWVWPDLSVVNVSVAGNRYRTPERRTPSSAVVWLEADGGEVRIGSDLRSPIRRTMTLVDNAGKTAHIEFAPGGLLAARVTVSGVGRGEAVVFEEPDDALGRNLRAAVVNFEADRPDPRLGEEHSTMILRCLDKALTAADQAFLDAVPV